MREKRIYKEWPRWFSTVKVGDILRSGSGTLRVVRAVSRPLNKKKHSPRPFHLWVTLAIRHCSWTGQATTILDASGLLSKGYTHTGHRHYFKSRLDRRLQKQLAVQEVTRIGEWKEMKLLKCCDVVGVLE